MAARLDPDDLRTGYFYTDNFEELTAYITNYITSEDKCVLVNIHLVAEFLKDDDRKELHMPSSDNFLFDPNDPNIGNLFSSMYDHCLNPESWANFESSGWTICVGTEAFWFKIIDHQPNNSGATSATVDPPTFQDDDPDDPALVKESLQVRDTLLLAIATHYNYDYVGKLSNKRRYPILNRWLFDNHLFPSIEEPKVNPSTLAAWHLKHLDLNLRVFSEFGNIIYSKKLNLQEEEYIDLLWKYKKFSLIRNLWTFLGEHSSRIFCPECSTFHRDFDACKIHVKKAKSVEVHVPEFPEGRHSLVVYADFESIVKTDNSHDASGYAYIAINRDEEIVRTFSNNALHTDDVPGDFISELFEFICEWTNVIGDTTDKCQICDEPCPISQVRRNFINGDSGCHHKECWDDIKNSVIVYFHNFRGYDSHYVIKALMDFCTVTAIRGKSFEKFDLICALYDGIQVSFKDTFNFLSTSIAKLVPLVKEWKYSPEEYRENKGVFPYKWFSEFDKLLNTELPSKEHWFNDLTNTQVDPTYAFELWKDKNFNYFHEYHDYYMHGDVFQLADIFEEFRRTCVRTFNLDCVYFQGAPSYTWQLGLIASNQLMKLIPDVKIYQDIQNNIRGGVSQVMMRYCNIKEKPEESILYLDVNSLYSKCMTYKLPTLFIGESKILPDNWQDLWASGGDRTALICVDLVYPEHLHDLHYPYPLAPHKYNGRLCTTFVDKNNYLCHAELLKFYLNEGLIISQFHYLYEFEQAYVLKGYVENNISERRKTNSPALQTLYKLLNNSIYGKTCENKFKYKKYAVKEPHTGQRGKVNSFLKKASNWLEINDKLLCEDKINEVVLDKPIQIGFSVLEFAKREIYQFLFRVLDLFGESVQPLYTDTDSIMLHFKHPHPEELLYNDSAIRPFLDFDKVPEHWKIRTPGTNKQNGLWSLECSDRIVEFIGLRAKTYCYLTENNVTVLKNKGVTAAAVELETQKRLTMDHYRKAIFEDKEFYVTQATIASKKHNIITKKTTKLAISANDEKRMIMPDKITSIPYGYKGLKFSDMAPDYENFL